jgi:hypothetical protein
MKNDKPESREEMALDALLAAALRQPEEAPITDEAVAEFLKSKPPLSEGAKVALKKLGPDVVSRLVRREDEFETTELADLESAPLYAAMNRKNAADQHNPQTEEELERKRKEILARLRQKRAKDKK